MSERQHDDQTTVAARDKAGDRCTPGPVRTVAFVGIGNMGGPMAANLARCGFDVVAVDADPERAAAWVADTIGACDAVVTMLPRGAEVRAVLTDPKVVAARPTACSRST